MQFTNFEEFWKALGRLHDETLEIKEWIREARLAAEGDRERLHEQSESIKGLGEATSRLLGAMEKLHAVAESHESRLDRTEVTVEVILEDLRRHREQRPSQ